MRPVQGHQHVLVAPARRPQRHQAAPHRHPVVRAPEVAAGHPHRGRADPGRMRLDDRHEVGPGLADDHHAPLFDDPGLVLGDALQCGPEHVGVVVAEVGQHGHVAVHHVGGVPRAAQSHLDHHGVDGVVGEPRPGGRREQFEAGGALFQHRLEGGQLGEHPEKDSSSIGSPL